LPVAEVREIILEKGLTRVPRANPVIRGLMNIRGEIVTALDLRRRLELHEDADSRSAFNIIVTTYDGPVALQVDEIGDVIEVHEELFEAIPNTLSGVAREYISGVYKLESRLMLVLATDRVIELSTDK
jgi:purine-binding chemotaxis protein CheW